MTLLYITKILLIIISCFILNSCEKDDALNNFKTDKILVQLGGKISELSFSFKSTKQKQKSRIWKEVSTKIDYKLGGIDDTTFYGPTRIKTDSEENIYVLDMQGCYVKKFDKNGIFLQKFGNKGRGPSEFTSPFRFDVSPKGQLVILDPNLNKCVIFGREKNHLVKCRFQPSDVCFVSEDEIVILQETSPIENSLLRKYNFKTNSVEDYQNILDTEKLEGLTLGALPFLYGYIISHNQNQIIYVPKYMSIFLNYSYEGKITQGFKTIDDLGLPNIEKKSYKLTDFRLPKEFHSSLGVFNIGNKVLLWNYHQSRKMKMPVIDYYSINDGMYLYSIKVERINRDLRVYAMHVSEENIYIINENSEVEVYKYSYL